MENWCLILAIIDCITFIPVYHKKKTSPVYSYTERERKTLHRTLPFQVFNICIENLNNFLGFVLDTVGQIPDIRLDRIPSKIVIIEFLFFVQISLFFFIFKRFCSDHPAGYRIIKGWISGTILQFSKIHNQVQIFCYTVGNHTLDRYEPDPQRSIAPQMIKLY